MGQEAPVYPGEILAGKYRVDRVLGIGGMGVVVAATHIQLGQPVALKFMLPEALANAEAVERFLREARAAVRLKSQHVARIIDVGTLPNGSPYIVMELLEGMDLERIIANQGQLPPIVAVDFVLQACDAIAEAHAYGIIHRDLKPANLFITRAASGAALVKVLDFGIAKAATSSVSMTQTSAVMGSPAYMSPEQMRSTKQVDARTDIWSLGVILYEAVSGSVPFRGESFTELCLRVAMDALPPLPKIAGLTPGLEAVIYRCLEKEPARRFPGVAELAAALAPSASPATRALAEGIQGIALMATGGDWSKVSSITGARPRRSRMPLFIAAAVLVAGAGAGLAIGLTGGKPTPPPATPDARPAVVTAPIVTAIVPDAPPARLAPPDAAPPPPDASPPPARRPDAAPTTPKPKKRVRTPEHPTVDPLENPD